MDDDLRRAMKSMAREEKLRSKFCPSRGSKRSAKRRIRTERREKIINMMRAA